ncbi:50S ribosomal protein L3 [Striga asiatica]|uniref:50S ribosomal protein L3 n=1 Tax=Striga asiatica TaxID=4170 RepID=A0A5A7PFV2_STRAF|nr:50S ribosomal protein L3 [Striga asiatica]
MQMKRTTTMAYHLGSSPGSPFTPNFTAMQIATTIWEKLNEHLDPALEEQKPPPPLVDTVNRHDGRQHIDPSCDHRRHQRGITTEPNGLEQHGRVKHNNIDPRELLEKRDGHGHREMGPVLLLEEVPPRVLDFPRLLARGDEVVELLVDFRDAADSAEPRSGGVVLAALDHGVGGLWEDEGADGDDEGGDHRAAEAEAPAPAAADFGEAVVEDIGGEDADCD